MYFFFLQSASYKNMNQSFFFSCDLWTKQSIFQVCDFFFASYATETSSMFSPYPLSHLPYKKKEKKDCFNVVRAQSSG